MNKLQRYSAVTSQQRPNMSDHYISSLIESFRKDWEAAHAADRAAWEAKEKALLELVNQQAEDEGLWFDATTAPEAYLQQELRKLHVAIEGKSIGEAILNRAQEKQP